MRSLRTKYCLHGIFSLWCFFVANLHKLSLPNTYDSSSRIVIFIIIHALRTQLDGVRTHSIIRSGLGRAFLHTYSLTHSRTHSHSPNRWRETESKTYTYFYYIYRNIFISIIKETAFCLCWTIRSVTHTYTQSSHRAFGEKVSERDLIFVYISYSRLMAVISVNTKRAIFVSVFISLYTDPPVKPQYIWPNPN